MSIASKEFMRLILIFIGIISLLISFGSLIVTFLAFLTRDKENKKK